MTPHGVFDKLRARERGIRAPTFGFEAQKEEMRMKKLHRICLTLVVALLAFPPNALGAFSQDENSITSISKENLHWEAQYENTRKETVSVDVDVLVPGVRALPVLKVTFYPRMGEGFQSLFRDPQGKTNDGWSSYVADEYVSAFHNWKHGGKTYQTIPMAELDRSKAYAQNNALTFGEAFQFMEATLKQLCTEYGSGNYYPMQIERVQIKGDPGGGDAPRKAGAYTVSAYQTIRGIPILMNVSECFTNSSQRDSGVPKGYFWNMSSTDSYYFTMSLLEEKEVLFEDIPILGFEQIRPAMEAMIRESRIRNVYGVRLGYVVFMNEPGSREHFVLEPAWVVECEYYDSAKRESPKINAGVSYFEQTTYRELIINAQSGELMDPESNEPERSVAPSVIPW